MHAFSETQSMSASQQLEEAIVAHVTPIAQRHHWQEVARHESARGDCRDYVSGSVYIRVANEMGLIGIEIGSRRDKDLRPVSSYKDLLAPPLHGRWNMSLEQSCEFIETEWDWFKANLSENVAQETIRAVDENARRRV